MTTILLQSLITPDPGLFIWTTLVFLLLWVVLGKYAWGPISDALSAREESIENSLKEAEKARAEMSDLESSNEKMVAEAREERAAIIKDAKEYGNSLRSQAKEEASAERQKIISNAEMEAANLKRTALTEAKNELGVYAVDLAKKILGRELTNEQDHKAFLKKEVENLNI